MPPSSFIPPRRDFSYCFFFIGYRVKKNAPFQTPSLQPTSPQTNTSLPGETLLPRTPKIFTQKVQLTLPFSCVTPWFPPLMVEKNALPPPDLMHSSKTDGFHHKTQCWDSFRLHAYRRCTGLFLPFCQGKPSDGLHARIDHPLPSSRHSTFLCYFGYRNPLCFPIVSADFITSLPSPRP